MYHPLYRPAATQTITCVQEISERICSETTDASNSKVRRIPYYRKFTRFGANHFKIQ